MACDRCGKRSYLHVTKDGRELDFCRHHGIQYSPKLEAQNWHFEWDVEGVAALTPGLPVTV